MFCSTCASSLVLLLEGKLRADSWYVCAGGELLLMLLLCERYAPLVVHSAPLVCLLPVPMPGTIPPKPMNHPILGQRSFACILTLPLSGTVSGIPGFFLKSAAER